MQHNNRLGPYLIPYLLDMLFFCFLYIYIYINIEYSILCHIWPILYHIWLILYPKHQTLVFLINQPSSMGCYFWKIYSFFELVIFPTFLAEPLYQNVRIDRGIILTVSEKWKTFVNTSRVLILGFSLSFPFLFMFEEFIEDNMALVAIGYWLLAVG